MLKEDAITIASLPNLSRPFHVLSDGSKLGYSEMLHGTQWSSLSENMQSSLVEYMYIHGIRPELGICIEYLSWNREHRLYIQWMRDLYLFLFNQRLTKDGPKEIEPQSEIKGQIG